MPAHVLADQTEPQASPTDTRKPESRGAVAYTRLEVSTAAFSPDGRWLLTGYHIETDDLAPRPTCLTLWDVATGREIRTWNSGYEMIVNSVAFLPDSKTAVTTGAGGAVKLWHLPEGVETGSFQPRFRAGHAIASPDGRLVLTNRLELSSIPEKKPLRLFESGRSTIDLNGPSVFGSVTFSPNGKLVLTGGLPQEKEGVALWDVSSGKMLHTYEAHAMQRGSDVFSRDGRCVLLQEWDLSCAPAELNLVLLDVETGQLRARFAKQGLMPRSAFFTSSGRYIVSTNLNKARKEVALWEVASEQLVWSRDVDAYFYAFCPRDNLLLTVAGRGTQDGLKMTLLDIVDGKPVREFGSPAISAALAVSP
jgi:WD40 repeat protein